MLTPEEMLVLATELTDAQADDDTQSLAAIAWQLPRSAGCGPPSTPCATGDLCGRGLARGASSASRVLGRSGRCGAARRGAVTPDRDHRSPRGVQDARPDARHRLRAGRLHAGRHRPAGRRRRGGRLRPHRSPAHRLRSRCHHLGSVSGYSASCIDIHEITAHARGLRASDVKMTQDLRAGNFTGPLFLIPR